jgi:glycosyltransferase involved in cell wall biosynthesis
MRVCFIGKYQPHTAMAGGIEKYADDLSSADLDFIPIYFGSSKNNIPIKRILLEAPLSSPKQFIEAVEKSKSDIIHINIPNPFAELMLLAYVVYHGKKQKIVATYHADAPHYTFTSYLADMVRILWLLPLLSLCDRIISTSRQYADSSFALRPFLKKVSIIPLGIDAKRSFPKRPTSGNKIIFIGRLYRYKGLDVLLKSFKKVVENRGDAHLFIVGNGPLKSALVRLSDELGLRDNVTFTDRLGDNEKDKLLSECDIFVMPSINRGEAFGISQLDAMCFGKPIISTNIKGSGVTFVNKNGKTGVVVEPNNTQQLADAILKLLSNEKLRTQMGNEGRKRLLKYFTKKSMIKETAKLYKSLI